MDPKERDAAPRPESRPQQLGSDILLAEDDADLCEALAFLLQEHGYTVRVAKNGAEALAQARMRPPALVITDYMMPVLNGVGLLEALERDPVLRTIPRFIITAAQFATNLTQHAPVFVKPVRTDSLLRAVRAHLPAPNHAA